MAGTYIAVKFDEATLDRIESIQKQLNLYNIVPRDKLHSTICYSRVDVPYFPDETPKVIGKSKGLLIFNNDKRALVLTIDSPYLVSKHELTKELGATYDYPDYIPHVTLSYDIGYISYDESQVPEIDIGITTEYVEALDLDWTDSL